MGLSQLSAGAPDTSNNISGWIYLLKFITSNMTPFAKPILIALWILNAGIAIGQNPITEFSSNYDKPVQILPPAPNAASLGRYGGINLGLSSGTVNIDVPVYEYQSQNIKLPISISYTSSGFKVDEIASRVGMQWRLNAGGVITRTVNGSIDEQSERAFPPAGMTLNFDMITFMGLLTGDNKGTYDGSGQGAYGHFDGQPDLFSFNFNGYSGQFILDTVNYGKSNASWKPVLLTHSNLKIDRYNSTGLDYAYKITTGEGVQYFFEAMDLTSSFDTSGSAGCNYPYKQNVPTAWYLTKIVHPNKDSIQLSYTRLTYSYLTGASQTIYKHDPSTSVKFDACNSHEGADANTYVPQLIDASCLNKLKTDGALLDEITSTAGGKIKFKYIARDDYDDKLVSSIEVYQPGKTTPCKVYDLAYIYPGTPSYPGAGADVGLNKRPFLTSLIERSPDNTLTKTHLFRYKDYDSLPRRLAYAQDHWGYFNGKANTTLIPTPLTGTYVTAFPQANANREAFPTYSSKGLLNSIIYPTGGKDSILYEGNQLYLQVAVPPKDTSISALANNGSVFLSSEAYSNYAVLSQSQVVTVSGYRNPTTTGDPSLSVTTVVLMDLSNNVVFSKALNHTDPSSTSFAQQLSLPIGSYRLKITVLGPNNYGGGTIAYKKGLVTYEFRNVNSGGVRVAKVMTLDNTTDKTIIKKYSYGKLSNPDQSSGTGVIGPVYEKILKLYKPCKEYNGGLYLCYQIGEAQYFTMHSNSLFNMYANASLPTVYSDVVEGLGENFEGGGIEHQFSIQTDIPAEIYLGNPLDGAPRTSYGNISGNEIYQNVFKKVGGINIPVKKVYTHYKVDSRVARDFQAYVGSRKYLYPCLVTEPITSVESDQFDFMYYYFKRTWIYEDTLRTLTYDDNGSNYVEERKITSYANPDHALPTSIQVVDSKGRNLVTYIKYPLDYTFSGTPTAISAQGIRNLQDKHVISPPIEQYLQRSNADGSNLQTVSALFTTYKPTMPLADSVFRLEIPSPTNSFAPTTISASAVSKNSSYKPFISFDSYDTYGHLHQQHKINDMQEVYFWGYNSTYPIARITGSDYATAASYVNQSIFDNVATTDAQMTTELNKLRINLPNAQVTTLTYLPLAGASGQTDPTGRTTFYEYDGLLRLLRIRDLNNYIIKQFQYKYQVNAH
jgi:hypothetical protein